GLCAPRGPAGIGDGARQAEAVYRALGDALAAEGLGIEALVAETVDCRRVRDHGKAARAARSSVLGNAAHPVTTVIGQPPLDGRADLEIAAVAVRPRSRDASMSKVQRPTGCSCEAPDVQARIVRLGDERRLSTGNIHGAGRDPFAEAYARFRVAEDLLADAGTRFPHVIRT